MAQLNEIVFPALGLGEDGSIVSYGNGEAVGRCNPLALWGTRYYDGLKLVDGRGELYTVTAAEPIPPISGLRRLFARLLNRPLRVDLELRSDGSLPLGRAKALVTEWLDRDPEFWEAVQDLDAWKAQVAGCESVESLIGVFAD